MTTTTEQTQYIYHQEYLEVCDRWIIFAEDRDGVFWFPVGPSCKAMGIDQHSQIVVIKKDSRFAPWLREMRLPFGVNGEGVWNNFQTTQCLRRREYSWWLGMIDPNNVRPGARERLEERQRALMDFADQVMFHRHEEQIAAATSNPPASIDSVDSGASLSGTWDWRCLRCGAPHCVVIRDGQVRIYLGEETE